MAIQDDFRIFPWSKCIRHVSGTTVWSAIAFYSMIQDQMEEPNFGTYERAIKYNTPTSFTMLNGWFLDNGDGSNILQYLTAGSIATSGYATVADPVYMLDMDNAPTAWTDFIAGDKDKRIEDDDVIVGPLLAYKNNYPTANTGRIWVRDTRATPIIIADTSKIDMTADAGTGTGTANGIALSGDEIYANLYTIATFPTDVEPQVYIYQDHPVDGTRTRLDEWSAFTNWDRGSIDVLIPIQLGGVQIDSGLVTAFVRQTGDSFTFVLADLSSGSRTPIATETAPDEVNVTVGEWYMFYDAEAGGGIAIDDVIQDQATDSGVPPQWYAEVVAITDWGTEGVLTVRGLVQKTAIADNDPFFVGTTQRGLVNGTPGDTWATWDAQTFAPVVGDYGLPLQGSLSGSDRVLRAIQDDTGTGKVLMQVYHTHGTVDSVDYTGTGRDPLYDDFDTNDVLAASGAGTATCDITLDDVTTGRTLISGFSDVTIAHINGTVTIGVIAAGPFIPGERVTWNAGANEGIYIKDTGDSGVMTLANVDQGTEPDAADDIAGDLSGATVPCDSTMTDANTATFAFEQQSAFSYAVYVEGGSIYLVGRSMADIYAYCQYYIGDGQTTSIYTSDAATVTLLAAEEYIKAKAAYTPTKPAPFGTLAGSIMFGAQGVWIEGQAAADANNIKLTNDAGDLKEPFPSVNITATNTRSDDVILILPATGGLPNKAQFTSHATTNVQGDSEMDRDAVTFPIDTPASGTFIVKDNALNEEHRYRYDSWTTTKITLAPEVAGTADGSTATIELYDTGVFASGVQRGDIIRNTLDASWGYIIDVVDANHVTTTQMRDSAGVVVPWAVGDTFVINSLIETYDASDTFFISYMDVIEGVGTDGSPGQEVQNILYLTPRDVIMTARNVQNATKLIGYETLGQITDIGLTLAVGRNEDEVYA